MKNIINIINFIIFFYTVSIITPCFSGINVQNGDDLSVHTKEDGIGDVLLSSYSGIFCDEEKSVINKLIHDSLSKEFVYYIFSVSCECQFFYNKENIWFESDVSPPICYFQYETLWMQTRKFSI